MSPGAGNEPRDHHYVFAHYTVREVCQQDPIRFFGIIASPDRDDFLAWLWEATEKRVGRPIADLDPADLSVMTGRVKDCPAILFKMPEPQTTAEAHLIGILLTGHRGDAQNVGSRYFTLERGTDLEGTVRTVLCEWVEDVHQNFGDGPPATVKAFVSALETKL